MITRENCAQTHKRFIGQSCPACWEHIYLSTSCLHGEHEYCQGDTGAAGTKVPAQCKFCAAPCICACHEEVGSNSVQVTSAAPKALRHQPEGGGGVRGEDTQGQEAAA